MITDHYLNPERYPNPHDWNARIDAKIAGKTVYHGRTCKHDQSDLRYVQTDACVACNKRFKSLTPQPKELKK